MDKLERKEQARQEKIIKEHIQIVGYSLDPEERAKAHVIIMTLRRAIGAEVVFSDGNE